MNAYMNQYQNTAVSTASPEQLLIMLYDGAIRFVGFASEGIQEKNYQKKTKFINKASTIINEFRATLDHEVGGSLASDLDGLYDFMLRELFFANSRNDLKKLEGVENILKELREGWVQAAEIVRKGSEASEEQAVERKTFAATM